MAGLIGTATGAATLLEGFLHIELEIIAACRTAIPALAGPDERAMVVALRDDHEERLGQLKRLAASLKAHCPEGGTAHEARTLGRIKLARRRGGDGAVLHALDMALGDAATAYRRGLRNAALPDAMHLILAASLESLERRRTELREAARLAA
jgi:hypothetical protein